MMKLSTILMCALALGLFSIRPADAELTEGTCDVEFHVEATMHKFTGTVTADPIAVKWDGTTASWDVQVEVEKMTTDKEKRDKEMFHMFHSAEHPHIVGQAEGVSLTELKDGDTFPINLTIGEETKELSATVSGVRQGEENGLEMTVSFDVSLKEYGLVPPKVLFLKVHDIVRIDAAYQFKP
jgi:polyisoprenoid-binding protein YceI